MKYINTKNKQIIINTGISKSITKTKNKNTNKTYTSTKYYTYLPLEVLILLLEKRFKTIHDAIGLEADANITDDNIAEYLDKIIAIYGKSLYLHFADDVAAGVDADFIIDVVTEKIDNSFKIIKTNGLYRFAVSKQLFNLLKFSDRDNFNFKYCLCFVDDVIDLNNCFVAVKLF